tara:strand:+ start:383 stop:511 length:129 start_codon:yes stop_codon:yes gene_type:complete
MSEKEILEAAEDYANEKERAGCSYWRGLKDGFAEALRRNQKQ